MSKASNKQITEDDLKKFPEVFLKELKTVSKRRHENHIDKESVDKEYNEIFDKLKNTPDIQNKEFRLPSEIKVTSNAGLVGLALSGGGIRSATFNLGLLQSLAKRGVLRCCDYLSTVSGGGYIGSCLGSIISSSKQKKTANKWKQFPFYFDRSENPDEHKEIKYLRKNSKYLCPNSSIFSLDVWKMISWYLSGLIITNLLPFSFLLLLTIIFQKFVYEPVFAYQFASIFLKISLILFAIMLVSRGIFSIKILITKIKDKLKLPGEYPLQEFTECFLGTLAGLAAFFCISGVIIIILPKMSLINSIAIDKINMLFHKVSIITIIGLITGLFKSKNENLQKILNLIFRISWIAVLPLILAELLYWTWKIKAFQFLKINNPLVFTLIAIVVLISICWLIDTNRISLHHFYRHRLSKAYIIKRQKNDEVIPDNSINLENLDTINSPYHLINATLNVPKSKNRYLRGRGADHFLFSQLYCGSMCTQYWPTEYYKNKYKADTSLATAMATSGAAISPQMGTSTNRILAFIMTMLNIRLNRWMPNPSSKKLSRYYVCLPLHFIKELFLGGKEDDKFLNLSDGGHIENLGVYPLIERRCRYIIVSDAGCDPNFNMNDLANLLRKIRIDFGVDIKINFEGLRQNKETGYTPLHYAVGTITYPECEKSNSGSNNKKAPEGIFLYIKTTLTGREPEDILNYKRQNSSFPDQTTLDQFFDEEQFESYRKLGELIGKEIFDENTSLAKIIQKELEQYKNKQNGSHQIDDKQIDTEQTKDKIEITQQDIHECFEALLSNYKCLIKKNMDH